MLIRLESEPSSMLEALVRLMHSRRWKVILTKIQGTTSVKTLESSARDMPVNLLQSGRQSQKLNEFRSRRLLQPLYEMMQKTASLE